MVDLSDVQYLYGTTSITINLLNIYTTIPFEVSDKSKHKINNKFDSCLDQINDFDFCPQVDMYMYMCTVHMVSLQC